MRALIVGAGSVGGYFGGRLAGSGRDVTFLVHPRRAAQLADGLVIASQGRENLVPVKLLEASGSAGDFDVILLAVKAYQLDGAISDFGAYVGGKTLIMPVLNGMRHMDTLRSRFGVPAVIGGVAKIAATLDERGRIVDQGSFHDLVYGEWSGEKTARILALDEFMKGAGFDARLSTEIEREMWEKWAMLASLGAITCLMDSNIGQIARAPGGTEFVKAMVSEIVRAVEAASRPLPESFKSQVLAMLTNRASDLTSSMYRDMKGGSRIEADQIIGDLVTRAAAKAVATPLLSTALVRLRIYETGREDPRA